VLGEELPHPSSNSNGCHFARLEAHYSCTSFAFIDTPDAWCIFLSPCHIREGYQWPQQCQILFWWHSWSIYIISKLVQAILQSDSSHKCSESNIKSQVCQKQLCISNLYSSSK
jgi:hypothetical protein